MSTDYDHKADFAKHKTYSWLQVKADGLWQDRIRSQIDAQLSSKGWTSVPNGGDASIAALDLPAGTLMVDLFDTGTKRLMRRTQIEGINVR